MAVIFISYRRADASGEAGRLYDRLSEHFGPDRVFRDVDTLRPGRRFPEAIAEDLERCGAMVVLMGPAWAGSTDDPGVRRIDDPDDYVRREVAAALAAGVPVIPALLPGGALPSRDALPPDLQTLALHQAMEIDAADFHDDVTRLIAVLEEVMPPARPLAAVLGRQRRRWAAAGAGVVALLGAGALLLPRLGGERWTLRSEPAELAGTEVRSLILDRGYFSAASNAAAAGLPLRLTDESLGGVPVVVDRATNLVWDALGSGRIVPGGRDGALGHVAELNAGRHGGVDDWRLPTLDEALALLRPEAPGGLHLPAGFDGGGAPFVWTADTAPDGGGWVVYYADGFAARETAGFNAYVRAVRSR